MVPQSISSRTISHQYIPINDAMMGTHNKEIEELSLSGIHSKADFRFLMLLRFVAR